MTADKTDKATYNAGRDCLGSIHAMEDEAAVNPPILQDLLRQTDFSTTVDRAAEKAYSSAPCALPTSANGPPYTAEEEIRLLRNQLEFYKSQHADRLTDIAVLTRDFAQQKRRLRLENEKLEARFVEAHSKRRAFYARCKSLEAENEALRSRGAWKVLCDRLFGK